MPSIRLPLALACLALVAALAIPAPAAAERCDTDVVPAATLLFPWFEVDLDHPNGRTTLIAVTNERRDPVLAHVVLWTDWAIPTFSFDLYLAGHDLQTINLRDLLVDGRLPRTGAAVSAHSAVSAPPVEFPGCNQTATAGAAPVYPDPATAGAAPVYPDPAISGAELERLRAFHAGECSAGGLRASSGYASQPGRLPRVARGYITVDTTRRCTDLTPADAGYFAAGGTGVASDRNVLSGDYFLVDTGNDFAEGEPAVHVEAFPGGFEAGDYTFYRRYVDGSAADDREPLGTQYSIRHLFADQVDGGTEAIVWRDTGSPDATPLACGDRPSWYEGTATQENGLPGYRVYFDESGRAVPDYDGCGSDICFALDPTGLATQRNVYRGSALPDQADFTPPAGFGFGKTYIATWHAAPRSQPSQWDPLQGWVTVVHSTEGRYSVGLRAVRLDSACAPAPIEPLLPVP